MRDMFAKDTCKELLCPCQVIPPDQRLVGSLHFKSPIRFYTTLNSDLFSNPDSGALLPPQKKETDMYRSELKAWASSERPWLDFGF